MRLWNSRQAFTLACALALLGATGCVAPDMQEVESSTSELKGLPAFTGGTYYQIDTANPTAGEITLLMFTAGSNYWAQRCLDVDCNTTESLAGAYKRYSTTLRFSDSNGKSLGTWSYTLKNKTLTLRKFNTHDRYALNPMSEAACDASGGGWTDDDLGIHGFNCICPGGMDWSSKGCVPCKGQGCAPPITCAAPLSNCSGTCVDLSSDPTNCGACNATCTKAQMCRQGVCQ